MRIGMQPLGEMQTYDQYMERKYKEWVLGTYWYLPALAFNPQHQGKGYASKLLNEMVSYIDKEGLPCYVESEGEKNVSVNQHFGSRVVEEFVALNATNKLVVMLRQSKLV